MKTTARFYSSLGLLLVLNVLVKPLWIFGIDRPVQNLAGTAVYGAYFALFNLVFMLNFLLDWGLSTFLNRELAADPAAYSRKTGFFLRLKLVMLLLYGAIVFFIARASGSAGANSDYLFNTAQTPQDLGIADPEMQELERRVRQLLAR